MAENQKESRQNMKQECDAIRSDLLNNSQVAAILGIRLDTVSRLIKKGQLPKHNIVINQRLKFWSRDFIRGYLTVGTGNK